MYLMTHRVSCPSNADAPADHLLNEMDICVHDMKLPIQELTRQIFAEEAVDYLTGDEVLADRESHLDGVGFVRYGDGGQLEFVPPVDLVGLGHGIFEHLLVSLLAQDGPDVHDLRLAAGPRAGAREEHRQQKQTHRVDHQAAPRASPPASGSARPASGQQRGSVALAAAGSIYVGGVSEAKKKEGRKKKWIYVQCGGMCMIILGAGCQPQTSKPHLAPFFFARLCRIPHSSLSREEFNNKNRASRLLVPPCSRVSLPPAAGPCALCGPITPTLTGWSLRAERLLSLVLTAVHARFGG